MLINILICEVLLIDVFVVRTSPLHQEQNDVHQLNIRTHRNDGHVMLKEYKEGHLFTQKEDVTDVMISFRYFNAYVLAPPRSSIHIFFSNSVA